MSSAAELARTLLGEPVAACQPAARGGNNRVFRVETRAGAAYALKCYPDAALDPRDRLGNEWSALSFMVAHGEPAVPRPFARADAARAALFEWIDGAPPTAIGRVEIDAMLAFLARLHGYRNAAEALPAASDAALSGAAIGAQIDRRLTHFAPAIARDAGLRELLTRRLPPLREKREATARAHYAGYGLDFDAPLTRARQSLCPSDFGPHNTLIRAGEPVFIDFDYFGWDDPAKLVGDVLWHPRFTADPLLRARFVQGALAIYGTDPAFAIRLQALRPLLGLVWVLILLNEFRDEVWALRGGERASRPAVEARQLARATRWFNQVAEDDRDPVDT